MKKHRISKRIFAMLLVICMVFTMLPANVQAYVKGDIEAGDMGMTNIQDTDKITWPIEIYDYSNDGMLFEYASATGAAGTRWVELDKEEDHVYMPDMTTDYYSDFTKDTMQNSYVVKSWFPTWGHTNAQGTDAATALKYHTFDSTLWSVGGTDLIDFRDRDNDGALDGYGVTISADGKYSFSHAYGYKFSIDDVNGTIDGEDATIINTASAYESCNPNWAVSVQLRPTGNENEYKVVKVVESPGSAAAAGITLETNDIIMVVHSAATAPGAYENWMDKVAALALKEGSDIITISTDSTTATVSVPTGQSDPNQIGTVSKDQLQYAVLVYRTSDLEIAGTLEAFLRDTNGNKYFGQYGSVASDGGTTSDWQYCVLDFNYFDVNGSGSYSKEDSWSLVANDIVGAGIQLTAPTTSDDTSATVDSDGYQFMVSHFAMFDTYGEADAYGQKALVYNKHHIQEIYPKTEYSADYTTSEIAYSHIANYWFGVHGITVADGTTVTVGTQYSCTQATDTNRRLYYNFDMLYSKEAELIDISAIGGAERADAKYAVLVYRVDAAGTLKAYTRDFSSGTTYGTRYYCDGVDIETSDTWTYKVFDVSNALDEYGQNKTQKGNIYSAGINFDSTATDYNFQVSHFALVSSPEEAEAYAKAAMNYNNYSGIPAAYYNPIYNNQGYGLLTGSQDTQLSDGTNLNTIYDKLEKRLGYNFVPLYSDTDYDGEYETPSAAEDTYASITDGIYYLEYSKSTDALQTVITDGSVPDFDGSKMSTIPFDGYTLYGTLTGGSLTAGLLEGALGNDGNPVYREQVVGYLANLLHTTLTIPEYEDGFFNYDFVRGEKSYAYGDDLNNDGTLNDESIDLATAIRRRLGINFEQQIDYDTNKANVRVGDMSTTQAKANAGKLKGVWADCKGDIETCYDAAYFLLNNLFVEGSYNETPEDTYDYLTLHKATLSDGKEAYVFDAGLTKANGTSALDYDKENKIIDYVDATKKNLYYTTATTTTTYFPFLPITGDNNAEDMTKSPYFADMGVGYNGLAGETYYKRDFNYVIKSSGEFVYHEDDGLFFDFEGDDDVYLFINGQLVLDIGGAHSITKQNININDYVQAAYETLAEDPDNERAKALAIEEGDICSFDFFYMERHGYGANCRIATNMRVTDPSLHVEKTAYQNEEEVPFGGVVNKDEAIEYNFLLENTGNTKLYNLTFTDESIGVTIDYTNGLTVKDGYNGTYVYGKDANGTLKKLDVTDLTAVVTGYMELEEGATTTETTYDEVDGVMVENEDGTGKYIYTVDEITFADKTKLIEFMTSLKSEWTESGDSASEEITNSGGGLWKHSTVIFKGIYYKLTDAQKTAGKFNNTVVVTATTKEKIDGSELYETLRSQAEHRVFIPGKIAYYQWAGHEIVITPTKLIADMKASTVNKDDPFYDAFNTYGLTADTINKIEETNFNGRPITTSTVSVSEAAPYNVTVKYLEAGGHVFYLKITYSNSLQSVVVPVVINTTDAQNSYTVLDYGLKVELTEKDGILKHDTLAIAGTDTTAKVVAITSEKTESGDDNTPEYDASYGGVAGTHVVTFNADADGTIVADDGTFVLDADNKLTYKPSDFMDGTDTIWAAVHVYENGTTPTDLSDDIDISTEVQMFKKVSVLPANVVYYEDDFPAITYTKDGALLTPENTFKQLDGDGDDEAGDVHVGSDSLTQSADQDQEYGRDDEYDSDSLWSGNSITQITINKYGEAANFEFTGTGFELISRTKAERSATIIVKVTDIDGTLVKNIPVITEFDNGADGGKEEIYQVPVIRVDDLTHGSYKVSILAMPTYVNGEDTSTTLFIDGFRIFNPLAETTENKTTDEEGNTVTTTVVTPGKNEHYKDSENGAVFEEIRKLIINGQAAIATYDEEKLTVSTGTVTWTENRNDTFEGNTVSSVNDYLAVGPNNEVYMDTDADTKSALVFYVEEQKDTDVHNLQIALRAMDKGMFEDGEESTGTSAKFAYGVMENKEHYWTNSISTNTTTEQYYTIDYKSCPYVSGKGYQVAIKLNEGMISYTSLKYNGLTIANMDGKTEGEAPTLIYVNGVLTENSSGLAVDDTIYPAFSDLRLQFIAKDTIGFDTINGESEGTDFEELRYQTRNGEDVRLIAFVKDLETYTSVSFTITVDGKTSKELVCTTAYAGLYATDEEGNTKSYTTNDIYNKEGYFVTYTINGYLASAYAGKTVKITATYTMEDGTKVYEARDVVIGTAATETPETTE